LRQKKITRISKLRGTVFWKKIVSLQTVKRNVYFERIGSGSREVDKEVNRASLSQEKENSEEYKCP